MKVIDVNKKSRAIKILGWALSVLFFLLVFFGGYFFRELITPKKFSSSNWVIDMIDKNYLVYDEETGKVRNFTSEDYASALVSALCDRYSKFYSREEYSDLLETNKNNFYGVGLSFLVSGNELKVFDVSGNSPAEKAGIRRGGIIKAVEYNGERTETLDYKTFSAAVDNIPKETDFKIYIYYSAEEEFTVSKRIFNKGYVYYSDSETGLKFTSESGEPQATEDTALKNTNLANDTAYILYKEFAYHSETQLDTTLNYLVSRGKSKLILDLRRNPGGYLDVLTTIAAEFLGKNGESNITVAISKNKYDVKSYYKTGANKYKNLKIVVLADYNTASASEALMGALTYYGIISSETTVISSYNGVAKTYGKGIMQTTFPNLVTGEAIKLTTDYLFWPDDNTCIHGKGIIATGENAVAPSEDESVDNELLRAVEILAAL